MTFDLNRQLVWKDAHAATSPGAAADLAMLNDLQGNILKGHGRGYTSNLFISFDRSKHDAACEFVQSIGNDVVAGLDQLLKAEAFRKSGVGGGTFVMFLLTAKGYDALGRIDAKPVDAAFEAGMQHRNLGDPQVDQWEPHLASEIHALILIGAETAPLRDIERDKMVQRINATAGAVTLLNPAFGEDGNALKNAAGVGLEHFGYADGVSQPLALKEDFDAAKAAAGGNLKWDPSIHLSQLLVPCPGGKLNVSFGSYFVFRKLEQKVRDFKTREDALSDHLAQSFGLPKDSVDSGASVVGRFENGRPFAIFDDEGTNVTGDPDNNFDFSDDPQGLKCPFAAHIRKSNPRSDIDKSILHLMARRGIPYGVRTDDPNDDRLDNKPTGGVGLLFMAFQSSISNQFEFTQNAWVNNVEFRNGKAGGSPGPVIDRAMGKPVNPSNPTTGRDGVIGQPAGPSKQRWTIEWGKRLSNGDDSDDFSGFVTLKGGEYFFAPSISFLKSIK